jgi:hypothetical protein
LRILAKLERESRKMNRLARLLAGSLLLAFAQFAPSNLYAACASPTAAAGSMNWNSGTVSFQYCDGTNWQNFGGGSPGGSTTQVQFNSSGALSGDSGFTYAGTGAVTLSTSVTDPLLIGGTGTTSTLKLRSTSGVGAAGADIIFQTGNNGATEAMRILNSGSVGIGTTSPAANLDVSAVSALGSATYGGGTNFLRLFAASGSAYSEPAIAFQESGTNVGAKIAVKNTANGAYDIIFANRDTTSTTSTMNERMRITNGGSVGIGTTGPNYKLDVNGDINFASSNYLRQGGSIVLYSSSTITAGGISAGTGLLTGTGTLNTVFGYGALAASTADNRSTAFGVNALSHQNNANSHDARNSAFGENALQGDTTGYYNVAVGAEALYGNLTGGFNTGVGSQALYQSTGNLNTAVGNWAGYTDTSGAGNIIIGGNSSATYGPTTGGSNILIGTNMDLPSHTGNYQLDIGNIIYGTGIDGSGTTLSTGSIGIGTTSPSTALQVVGTVTATTFSGAHSGSGASLTSLNASNLSSGTVPTAQLGSGTANSTTYLRGDSTWATVSASGGLVSQVAYTSTQTITIPAGATQALVKLWGGAGGGGGGNSWSSGYGGGGGGGGYLEKFLTGLTAGNTLALIVGAAGTGGAWASPYNQGATGGAGGNSSLASGTQTISTLTANGGAGGVGQYDGPAAGGAAGAASGGDLNIPGQTGSPSTFDTTDNTVTQGIGGMTGGGFGTGGNGGGTSSPGSAGIKGSATITWYK